MGKLFVVGIGPGGPDGMTIAARRALEAADIVVGYTKYVELALAAVPDAEHLATPMMHEVERCRLALSRAQSGEAVALVCSGDAGVYGMASPVLELAEDYPDVDVEVIAGTTAAQSGSAVLGAPLAHDFAAAVIARCGITLGIFVGQHGAHGLHDLFAYEVLRGDQFDAMHLTAALGGDQIENLGVSFHISKDL